MDVSTTLHSRAPNKVQLNFHGILVSFGLISVLARPINFTPLGISRLDKVVQQMEVEKMAIFYPQNKVVLTIFVAMCSQSGHKLITECPKSQ